MMKYCLALMLMLFPAFCLAGELSFEDNQEGELTVYEDGKPVIVYNYGDQSHPDAPNRTRNSYIHPVYNVDGTIVTGDFPRDHYHHRGIFWTWQRVFWKDREYDFWTLNQDQVRLKFDDWLYKKTDGDTVAIGIDNGWYIGEECIIDEKVEIVVHPAEEMGRAIDFKLTFAAVDEDVTITGARDKGYSGFGIRFADHKNTQIATSSGLHTQDMLMVRSRWADYAGQINGDEYSGIAVFAAPDLPDFPPAWFLRHYGYYGVCWPGLDTYTFKKDDAPMVRNYRVWIHKGNHEDGKVLEAFNRYYENY